MDRESKYIKKISKTSQTKEEEILSQDNNDEEVEA